eukprot:6177369-Pleurochrysis_carterae.AAC.1
MLECTIHKYRCTVSQPEHATFSSANRAALFVAIEGVSLRHVMRLGCLAGVKGGSRARDGTAIRGAQAPVPQIRYVCVVELKVRYISPCSGIAYSRRYPYIALAPYIAHNFELSQSEDDGTKLNTVHFQICE